MTLIGTGVRLRNYHVGPVIAAGPRARIYLAQRLSEPRCLCALKVLRHELAGDSRAREQLKKEASILRALSHPSIEPLLDFGSSGGELFYVVRLSAGLSLRELQSVAPSAWQVPAVIEIALAILESILVRARARPCPRLAHGRQRAHR